MSFLSVSGLSKQFGDYPALLDISFELMPGEILGLIGPNGSGKSTLLECLTGLLPADAGTLVHNGEQMSPNDRKQLFWYQPDDILPFSEQRVMTTLSLFQRLHGTNRATLTGLINDLDLSSILKKPLHTLSKGYQRRTLLVLGLLSRQPVLLLDEPFDGFDLRQTLAVMDLLRNRREGQTLLLSIHQLSEAEKICDRFLLLDQGRLLGIGTRGELCQKTALNPEAPLEEVFLALT